MQYLSNPKGEKIMAKILLEVTRTGTIVVDEVENIEDAVTYIENCNPISEVDWSDFIEVKRIKEI